MEWKPILDKLACRFIQKRGQAAGFLLLSLGAVLWNRNPMLSQSGMNVEIPRDYKMRMLGQC